MRMATGTWLAPAPTSVRQAIGLHRPGSIQRWSGRLSLGGQFRWASLLILVFAMIGVGAVVTQQAESSALNRTAALTALYVDSVLSDQLAGLATQPRLSPSEIATLNHLLHETTLGERLVDFRVWSPSGEVLYSSTESLIGQHHPLSDKLACAAPQVGPRRSTRRRCGALAPTCTPGQGRLWRSPCCVLTRSIANASAGASSRASSRRCAARSPTR